MPSGISASVEADVQLLFNGLSSELNNETIDVFAEHLAENLASFDEVECILTILPSIRHLHRNLQEGGIYVNLHVDATSSVVDAALSTFTEQVYLVLEESAGELVADLKEQYPSYFEALSSIEVDAMSSNSPTKFPTIADQRPCRWRERRRCGKSRKKSKSAKTEESVETPTTSIKTGKSSKSSKKKHKAKDVESLADIKRKRKHGQAMSIITLALPEVDEEASS